MGKTTTEIEPSFPEFDLWNNGGRCTCQFLWRHHSPRLQLTCRCNEYGRMICPLPMHEGEVESIMSSTVPRNVIMLRMCNKKIIIISHNVYMFDCTCSGVHVHCPPLDQGGRSPLPFRRLNCQLETDYLFANRCGSWNHLQRQNHGNPISQLHRCALQRPSSC